MPATTIKEVIDQLTIIINDAQTQNNRAGYFAALYKKVTQAVAEKINEGYFDDNQRMEKLDVIFANRYLNAFENYYNNQPTTTSWQIAFDTCKNWPPMVMHHLLMGMNAHIGLDLGISTATVSAGANIQNIQNDFNKINIILSGLVNQIKADLFNMWPLGKLIDKLNTGKLENEIAGFSMTVARDAAWQVALDYNNLNGTITQQNYILSRDKNVAAFSNKLLHPGTFIDVVSAVCRVFEFGTIPSKIKKLDK